MRTPDPAIHLSMDVHRDGSDNHVALVIEAGDLFYRVLRDLLEAEYVFNLSREYVKEIRVEVSK